MDCYAFCTSTSYKVKPFYESIRSRYKAAIYRDVVHVEKPMDNHRADIFFFGYGVTVFWGMPRSEALLFLNEIKSFEQESLEDIETDEFTYIYGEHPKVVEDEIVLPNSDTQIKFAISHGIAQSVKLGTFEITIQKTFNNMKSIPEDLAKRGRILLSRKEIRTRMGALFIERTSINLHLDVLDTPEFFWEYPELEPYYKMISNYLDLQTRVEVLNQRLNILHELFEMLGNELNHQHSTRLELVIIWLIVIEVILILMKDVFHIL